MYEIVDLITRLSIQYDSTLDVLIIQKIKSQPEKNLS